MGGCRGWRRGRDGEEEEEEEGKGSSKGKESYGGGNCGDDAKERDLGFLQVRGWSIETGPRSLCHSHCLCALYISPALVLKRGPPAKTTGIMKAR